MRQNAARSGAASPHSALPAPRGYQWKRLFLPEGSSLRMVFRGAPYFASVSGDAIVYQGNRLSPRQLTLAIAGEGRNAWRDLWICLPGETRWRPASLLRSALEKNDAPPLSPFEALGAAASCMAQALQALALSTHVKAQPTLQSERRAGFGRRATDILVDDCACD
ncbi:MAG: hypothetical protein V4508_15535 [Pseudomonadota bacterium]